MIPCAVVAYAVPMHIYIEACPFKGSLANLAAVAVRREKSHGGTSWRLPLPAVYPNRAALNVQDIFMSMVDACLAAGDMKSLVEVFQELV